jgi:malate dehydrogenase (oxaloacetate-decarboxylating)
LRFAGAFVVQFQAGNIPLLTKDTMPTPDELLAQAQKPAAEALRLHPFYRGKVQVLPKCPVHGLEDFAIWYSPGDAPPCRAIQANPDLVYEHTNWANSIAIVSDGSRVLGLGISARKPDCR